MCVLAHLEINSFLAFIHAGSRRGGQDAEDRIAARMYGLPPSITEMMESPCAGVARPLNLDNLRRTKTDSLDCLNPANIFFHKDYNFQNTHEDIFIET